MEFTMASFCVTLFDTVENPAENDACFLTTNKDLTLNRGSFYRISFLLSKNNQNVNLLGYSLRGFIKESISSTTDLLTLTSANQLLVIDNSSSSIIMFIPESFTTRVSKSFAYYEITLLNPLSQASKIIQGIITFV